ncbi:MAG: Asp-tRNA(Asn)/Glu-tRNA(Gln) amidotransferase subunit GatC [Betaproteobacteria bacterium]|nr:Asp-tRNA(Asn)/Glu-tRNA(Gln) amidotransferase subunit GatC [Betaproteobacteria bacterium]
MSLNVKDIIHLSRLSRLALNETEQSAACEDLNGILALVERLRAVDTSGVTPLSYPLAVIQEIPLRLRDDVVTENDQREANMANAPQQENGLFLVPKVIE